MLGLLLILLHIVGFIWSMILVFLGILIELDPFYFVFEFILPSVYERDRFTIFLVLIIRIFLCTSCLFEILRFGSLNLFVGLFAVHTMFTCLQQLIKLSFKSSERTVIYLYDLLCVTLKMGEQFNRFILSLIMTSFQFILTTNWWMVLKCSDRFPFPLYLGFVFNAAIFTLGVAFVLPRAVLISEISKKFVASKTFQYQTCNRWNARYYYFCKWRAHKMLAIKFGIQFILSKDTPVICLDVLLANITNAVLLVNF